MAPSKFFGNRVWNWMRLVCSEAFEKPDQPTEEERYRVEYILTECILYVLPCESCRSHYIVLLRMFPPDTRSRRHLQLWQMRIHNCVNEFLGARRWSTEEADVHYLKEVERDSYPVHVFVTLWRVAQLAIFEQPDRLSPSQHARLLHFICHDLPSSIPPNAQMMNRWYVRFVADMNLDDRMEATWIAHQCVNLFATLETTLFGVRTLFWPLVRDQYEQERMSHVSASKRSSLLPSPSLPSPLPLLSPPPASSSSRTATTTPKEEQRPRKKKSNARVPVLELDWEEEEDKSVSRPTFSEKPISILDGLPKKRGLFSYPFDIAVISCVAILLLWWAFKTKHAKRRKSTTVLSS